MHKPLTSVVHLLQHARAEAHKECLRLDAALKALGAAHGSIKNYVRGGSAGRAPMSMAARKRIAAAQRRRWKAWKAAKRQGKK